MKLNIAIIHPQNLKSYKAKKKSGNLQSLGEHMKKTKMPLDSALCAETIKIAIMTHRVVEVLENEQTQILRELAKEAVKLVIQQYNATNPTYN